MKAAPSAFGTYHSLRSGTRPANTTMNMLYADSAYPLLDLGEAGGGRRRSMRSRSPFQDCRITVSASDDEGQRAKPDPPFWE